jgi:hypothetical protein
MMENQSVRCLGVAAIYSDIEDLVLWARILHLIGSQIQIAVYSGTCSLAPVGMAKP